MTMSEVFKCICPPDATDEACPVCVAGLMGRMANGELVYEPAYEDAMAAAMDEAGWDRMKED